MNEKKPKKQLTNDVNSKLSKKKQNAKKWSYSLLTVLLVVFLAQLVWGVIINSAKVYSLRAKIATLEKINKTATHKNQYLREELEKYTSNMGVEALARNRLQFSKEDETLVIIKTPQQNTEEQ